MYQNYFEINGVKYYTGTVIVVAHGLEEKEVSFICYDTDNDRYIYKRDECVCNVHSKLFWKSLIAMTNKNDNRTHMPAEKTFKDRYIDGLPLGWLWYIFLMLISTIFKYAICLWIFISVVFFSWRAKKIKEEGTYIEW